MKRKKIAVLSATATALVMTSLLSGCGSEVADSGNTSVENSSPYQSVSDDEPAKSEETTKQSGTGTNAGGRTCSTANTTTTTVNKDTDDDADTSNSEAEESDNEVTIMDQSSFDKEFNGGQVNGNVSSGDNESYDQQAYENLGIKVYLHGTNEEQAQQWADALNEAYPNLNMYSNGNSSGADIPYTEDMYSMTPDEIDSKIMDALGGKDWHDCNIGELANAMPWCGGTELGLEISTYFGDQVHRDFNWGDYHIIG